MKLTTLIGWVLFVIACVLIFLTIFPTIVASADKTSFPLLCIACFVGARAAWSAPPA